MMLHVRGLIVLCIVKPRDMIELMLSAWNSSNSSWEQIQICSNECVVFVVCTTILRQKTDNIAKQTFTAFCTVSILENSMEGQLLPPEWGYLQSTGIRIPMFIFIKTNLFSCRTEVTSPLILRPIKPNMTMKSSCNAIQHLVPLITFPPLSSQRHVM